MGRDVLDAVVKADLNENGPATITEIATRIGRSHGVTASIVARLVDDETLYRAATIPGSYQHGPTPIYWFTPPPTSPTSSPQLRDTDDMPTPRMADTRPDACARLALLLEIPGLHRETSPFHQIGVEYDRLWWQAFYARKPWHRAQRAQALGSAIKTVNWRRATEHTLWDASA